jgi:hypothetical protein
MYRFLVHRHGDSVDSVLRDLQNDQDALVLAQTLIRGEKIEAWRDDKLVFSLNKDGHAEPKQANLPRQQIQNPPFDL